MIAAVTARLARVRGGMTDTEFGRLVADVVRTADRFAAIDSEPGLLRPAMPDDEMRRLLDTRAD